MNDLNKEKYDWIIVGGGISGISIAEILCREGKSVLLIEKNHLLASETSKVFHEWLHSGALYTLAPDNLMTLRYLLGAIDDLLEYYSTFPRMNILPTESGIGVVDFGWFNAERIEYKYKVRKMNPAWMTLVSRSASIVNQINTHDFLRRRAGAEYGPFKLQLSSVIDGLKSQIKSQADFFIQPSPDVTMNSRLLFLDLLSAAINKGLSVVTGEEVLAVNECKNSVEVKVNDGTYYSKNVVICSPDFISKQLRIPIVTSYAPIAVVENVPEEESSFVELDYHVNKCINLLKKEGGIGQAGGITVKQKKDVAPYINYVINEHKKRNPEINVIDTYIGLKKELVHKGQSRNYLYHINQNSSSIWSVVLGKFTLAFSMAPEFYRRVYHANPSKVVSAFTESGRDLISDTSWHEILMNKRKKNGDD